MLCAQAAKLATRIKDPKVGVPVGGTTAALSLALYNYHITLEVGACLFVCVCVRVCANVCMCMSVEGCYLLAAAL